MDREKLQIQELLCTANRNGAVHGFKPPNISTSPGTALCSDADNSENAYLPTNNNTIHFKYNLLDELLDVTQVHGPWLTKHPLPLPVWAPRAKDVLKFDSVLQYEYFASQIEFQIQQLLEHHNYNTIGNFLALYQGFKESGCYNLRDYLHTYLPPITPIHHTCVGLALELWTKLVKLNEKFPGLTNYLYLVSCEENIETVDEYTSLGDHLETVVTSLEKEHVLLALRFEISGRYGVLLCDPGKFVQSQEAHSQKEYNYAFSSNMAFIQWTEILTKTNGVTTQDVALIYISKPYLTAVDVTERRNLVYNFRSLLSRDSKGILKAGVYFKIKENYDEFTIFYQDVGVKKRLKYNFGMFLQGKRIDEGTQEILRECSTQLNLTNDALESILISLANLLCDQDYIKQLLEINCQINNLAADN
ncbi:hypothetical protein RN001_013523 [Aquatica leii]|uniref:Uncharacterized protein n=1 Tax=Aquatica leii TaxID=1421715 RepID=A0AAN7P2Y2_9COLE|nr:hypothetical protein RN001_013523 [Aquatica leii]